MRIDNLQFAPCLQALICSCFYPLYCGVMPPSYHGIVRSQTQTFDCNFVIKLLAVFQLNVYSFIFY